MNRYKFLLLPMLLMVAGCTKELLTDELPGEHRSTILTLSARIGSTFSGPENESIIKTLRILVFNSSGAQIANSCYTETALDELRNTANGTFTLTERLPRDLGMIKVCLIANEPSAWNLGRTANKVSYTTLSKQIIHYSRDFDFIGNNGNNDDLNLYILPEDYFLMYAETAANFTVGDVTISEILPLERTMAKVTLTLGYNLLTDVDYDKGETFTLKSISIQNQPLYSHLFAAEFDSDEFFSTAYQSVEYDEGTHATRPVTFYIPEHYLSATAFDSDLMTYIEVLGEYTTGNVKIPIVYKIPLGNGVQKLYSEPGYALNISDYSVVRNHHYVVNGRITKLGEKDGLQVRFSILPWAIGDNVNVEDSSPYLNISDISQEYTVYSDMNNVGDLIYFWSNQPQEQIVITSVTAIGHRTDHASFDITDLDEELRPTINVALTKYSANDGYSGFFENNGHIYIGVSFPPNRIWDQLVVSFYLKAGNLKRLITVTYYTG